MYKLYFDGLFRPVKEAMTAGMMCFGWLIHRDERLIAHGYGAVARGMDATSNVAEYLALIDGLEALVDIGVDYDPIRVYGDARVIINQMQGVSRVSVHRTQPLYRRACKLARQLYIVDWHWLPRSHNKPADALSRLAWREIRANRGAFENAWRDVLRDHARRVNRMRELGGMLVFKPGPA